MSLPASAPVRAIVLDFDGTFTDAEAEGAPFEAAYRDMLGDLVAASLEALWPFAQAEVAAEAPELGWVYGGHVVAPADADPYIRAGACALKIFDRTRHLVRHRELRAAVTRPLYDAAYARSAIVFREDARDSLEALLATGIPLFVVTNADTDRVKAKIARLGLSRPDALTVFGNARKYAVTEPTSPSPLFSSLPASVRAHGLARPVLLRRGAYFDALREIWSRTGAGPQTTFVCGDIYELDLALPSALGAHVVQVTRPALHGYERDLLGRGGRGQVAGSLGEAVAHLRAVLG